VFDATDDYINIPTTSSINDCLSGDFTYEIWTFPKTNGFQYGKLFGKGAFQTSTGFNGLTYDTTTYNTFFQYSTNPTISHTLFNLPPNFWYHLVITRSGTNFSGYVNGNISSNHTTSFDFRGNYPLRISANNQPSPDTVSQNVPVFKQYNRALTESEIQQNFNATKGRFGL
jgi:hypothetical protein